jgi:hypothetical protein
MTLESDNHKKPKGDNQPGLVWVRRCITPGSSGYYEQLDRVYFSQVEDALCYIGEGGEKDSHILSLPFETPVSIDFDADTDHITLTTAGRIATAPASGTINHTFFANGDSRYLSFVFNPYDDPILDPVAWLHLEDPNSPRAHMRFINSSYPETQLKQAVGRANHAIMEGLLNILEGRTTPLA